MSIYPNNLTIYMSYCGKTLSKNPKIPNQTMENNNTKVIDTSKRAHKATAINTADSINNPPIEGVAAVVK